MRFLARDEAKLMEEELRRQIADEARPKLVLYSKSSNRDYSPAAKAITASIGAFTEVTLHFSFCVSGDGWNEHSAADKRWSRYRQWRAANGESRRLYDAPGHQFEPHEAEHLAKAIE